MNATLAASCEAVQDVASPQQASTYFAGVIVIMIYGFLSLARCTFSFVEHHGELPFIIKSYASVLAHDWFLVVNYFLRDTVNFNRGYLDQGPWCTFTGFVAVFSILALRIYYAVTAYATYRLVKGNPLDTSRWSLYIFLAWLCGGACACVFLFGDCYGSYKGIYCVIRESHYFYYGTVPCFTVTFTSIILMVYFYYLAYEHINEDRKAASPEWEILVKRGFSQGSVFYMLWSIVLTVGCITTVGGRVPVTVDMAGAWLLKTQPIVNSNLMQGTIDKLLEAQKKKGEKKKDI